MKKLMIVAALAAMTGAAFADAQVYDVQLKVKTTACKKGKLTKALADLGWFGGTKGDEVYYRKSASRKIAGMIWGCDCDTIARPAWRVWNTAKKGSTVGGYIFWDQTSSPYTAFEVPYVSFNWAVLNRVSKMKNVEGTWMLADAADGEAFYFLGAGFGTATLSTANDCASYIKSMKGSFAGFMQYVAGDDGCVFCGETTDDCLVAPFCVCLAYRDTTSITSAYGTWQIKYSSKGSKSLKKQYYITKARSFTATKYSDLNSALVAAYKAITGNDVPTASDSAAFDVDEIDYKPTNTNATDVYFTTNLTLRAAYYTALKTSDPGSASLPTVAQALIDGASIAQAHVEAEEDDDDDDDDDDDWDDDDDDDDDDEW